MKHLKALALCAIIALAAVPAFGAGKAAKVVVAYVTSWSRDIPDPSLMTHINYAFGAVSEDFRGVSIANEGRLRTIAALKKENPHLRVLLSVGGWGSGRFSEMAASDEYRALFARACRKACDDYNLDGIDIDWEYPTQSGAGISSSPQDTEHFTLLMRDLRKALGRKRLLTIANVSNAAYIDFRQCLRYIDWVNVMSYDMGNPPRHHSALYPSARSGWCTTSQAIDAHLKAGVPADKIVMGVPFYGRGKDNTVHYFRNHGNIGGSAVSEQWDEQAQVAYLADETGQLVCGFENPRSLSLKCGYAIDHGLRGMMYWEWSDDDTQHDLACTLWLSMQELRPVIPERRVLVLAEQGTIHQGFVDAVKAMLDSLAPQMNMRLTYVSSMKDIKAGVLPTYHAILQLNYPPYAWSDASARDFERYIDEGQGGYIGFHHASLLGDEFDGYRMWQWFSDFMGGIRFRQYIAATTDGTVCVEDGEHPVMKGVPRTFTVPKDEWYTYDRDPRPGVHVLAHVDEASYTPPSDIRMGDHPVIWVNPAKKARNVYFQIGHHADLAHQPAFRQMLVNALHWALCDR